MILFSLVQHEPKYFEPALYFLLLHRQVPAARRLLASAQLDSVQREVMSGRLESVACAHGPGARAIAHKPGVVLTGPFWMVSSVARINRAVARALMQAGDIEVALEPHGCAAVRPESLSDHAPIAAGLTRHVRSLDLTIRHHWPPKFDRPSRGKLAVIIPWEFAAVPRKWAKRGRKLSDRPQTPWQLQAARRRRHPCRFRLKPLLILPRAFGARDFALRTQDQEERSKRLRSLRLRALARNAV